MAGHQVRGAVSCGHWEGGGRGLGPTKPDPGDDGETREETQHRACLPDSPAGSEGTIDSVLSPCDWLKQAIWQF